MVSLPCSTDGHCCAFAPLQVIESGACSIECDRVLQGSLRAVLQDRPDLAASARASARHTIRMLVDLGVFAPLSASPYVPWQAAKL